ncbi:hypothetical protein QYF36_023690 [Acer negundo]|nr:hypothetical protein QYF36_023690 [Acer negundo]
MVCWILIQLGCSRKIEVPFEQRPEEHPSALDSFKDMIAVAKGKKLVLFLDYDGTLSPIVKDPDKAFMSDAALKDETNGGTSSFSGSSWDPGLEIEVPFEQRPVKPVIKLLKQTLIGTGALLVTAVSLFIFATPVEHFFQTPFASKENTSDTSASKINKKSDIRKEDLLQLPMEVKSDDDLAAAAADAADGRPVYCRDRFYRVLAGGQYCKWEDLLK